ncbi:hypothetical protein VOLCADRAFT_90642 [Volvox carteri f. nagariensis]|uniref:C3H1-type domain-containing protein n=1 Tax=Volvox carteri f. nagariensis TaxID=3068 RepID=D8TUY4_VOLCA|nr:uncharacterized protein VOLCADRAFT_90642 [Volvox carteri f. nagariensis]EFJ48899.1 hypothetical protein VOLCADRAFT_90642 [Volvox carteri f. nagariensis]|eukprot:XP_002950231.1 hypothetical protein VOLCADRAFT_90642 [Volvox carteri f. nagariensis]
MESRLTAHMDSEDRRVKELTEGILYDFLPSALNVMLPRCEDHLQELDTDRCRAVASAALAVSALMNAPAGFLEFLLCVPWRKLSQLYPKTPNLAARSDSIDKLVSNLQVTDEERRKLANTRIDPALMGTVLDFLYKDKHADSVPPMLQLTPVNPLQPDDKSAPLVVRETVAAVLDGATPLHCAALRGNPAQVDHLLYCGADPTLKTAAGELPIELVPVCGDRATGSGCSGAAAAAVAANAVVEGSTSPPLSSSSSSQRNCRCMGPHDQEVWECRSRLARSLIARRCFFSFGVGLFSWLRLVVFCLLCLLGQAGCYTSINRPVVERHIDTRRQQKVAAARARAHALVTRMRAEAEAGLHHLEQAKRECMESAAFHRGPPDISQMCFTDPNKSSPPPPPPISQIHDINLHLQESGTSSTGEELASEKAFKCFVRSVHALQSLDLHGDVVPQVFAELVAAGSAESRETHVLEDEQAVRMAHIQATRLFGKVDRVKQSHTERWRAVGQALARVVYVHICLLLETEAQASPTRSLVWRAEQCLREWDRLEKAELTQGAGVLDPRHVAALQLWAKTADSDLYLAEALHGQSMPPTKTLQEVVQGAVIYGADNTPILARPVSADVVASLEQALTLSSLPSPMLANIVRGVVANAVAELAAAARLREFVGTRGAAALGGAGSGTSETVAALTEALRAAEPFRSRLGPEMDAAQELHGRWTQRAQALEKLESAVEEVRAYITAHPLSFSLAGAAAAAAALAASTSAAAAAEAGAGGPATRAAPWPGPGLPTVTATASSSGPESAAGKPGGSGHGATSREVGSGGSGGGESSSTGASSSGSGGATGTAAAACGEGTLAADLAEWDRRMRQLEAAMNDAKDANISVTKAKRLVKEMTTVAAAAEASRQLEAVMARRPSGPMQLKLALNKAEAAASTLGSLGGAPLPGLADVLGPLVAAARRRLDTERAAEALSKAAASYRTLADLARLEAAIYNAKKIGAEELDPESYRTSLELRAHLQEAARMRTTLETALRNLQNQLRPEDAEVLERALQDAARWEDLLAPDLARARKALEHWRAMTVSDAKLARLLREGASTGVLARAIQEAAASGVKVQQAKRVLKLMQALETVLAGGGIDGGAAERYAAVKAKLEAAELGGVTAGPLPDAARRMLARLAAQIAREALEAALKPHSDWSMAQRISVLRDALEKAEGVLAAAANEQQQQQQEEGSDGKASSDATAAAATAIATAVAVGVTGTQQEQHQTAPKLSNASATGKTSRGKRCSGSSVTVRELVRKARRVLEEDQAEMARIERERQEADRAKKEAQERQRQERQRQEQERQKREKAEAAERERLQAEKRERVRAERARQLHQNQQHQSQHQHKAKAPAATAAAAAASDPGSLGGPEKGGKASAPGRAASGKGASTHHHQGSGPNGGGGNARSGSASITVSAVAMAAGKAGSALREPQVLPQLAASAVMAAARHQPSAQCQQQHQQHQQQQHQHQQQQQVSAVTTAAQSSAAASAVEAVPAGDQVATSAASAAVSSESFDPPPTTVFVDPPQSAAIADPGTALGIFAVQLLSANDAALQSLTHQAAATNNVVDGAIVPACLPPNAVAAVHTRGDSMGSLSEVVRNLNLDVIEALDMDHDVSLSCAYSPLDAGAVEATVAVACGGCGDSGTPADGGGSGGGSVTRTMSGVTAAAESVLDRTPSQRTSSVMSSVASADDDMLHSAAGAARACSVAEVGGGGGGGCALGSLSSISSGQPGASNASLEVSSLTSLSATANSATAGPDGTAACRVAAAGAAGPVAGGPLGGGAGASNSSNGNGGGAAAKPRFGLVDLGGASWGLDPNPVLTGVSVRTASLFGSLQPSMGSSMGEFGSMLCAPKPDAGGGGWAAAPLGAAVGAMLYNGQAAVQGLPVGGPDDAGNMLGSAATVRHVLGGSGGGNGMHVRMTDASFSSLVPVHASPRTTVATASTSVDGILQVRPLGAGGMPGNAPPLLQLAPTVAAAAGSGGSSGSGRSSLHLAMPLQQPQVSNGAGLAPRSGYWTPPSCQAPIDIPSDGAAAAATAAAAASACNGGAPSSGTISSLQVGGGVGLHHLSLGTSPVGSSFQMLDWSLSQQHQKLQPQLPSPPPPHQHLDGGLQLVHLGGGGGGGGGPPTAGGSGGGGSGVQVLRSAGGTGATGSRICHFFLSGYCQKGERCRFLHHIPAPAAGSPLPSAHVAISGGSSTVLQLGQGSPPPPQLSPHHLRGQVGCFGVSGGMGPPGGSGVGAGAGGGGGGNGSGAVGSFAFGVPGAEAFAPLGPGGGGRVSRASTGMDSGPSGQPAAVAVAEQQQQQQQVLLLSSKRASVNHLRHNGVAATGPPGGAGVMSGTPLGLILMDRNQPGPVGGGLSGPGSSSSSGGGGGNGEVVLGSHQQPVQLRDSATGATFAAVLTVPGVPIGGGSFHAKQLQQQQQLQPTSARDHAAPQQQQQQQQPMLLTLPDDLSYSPRSSSSRSGPSSR